MAKSCEFGVMREELIQDRLVVRIYDNALSKRLQMKIELTLDKAKWLIHQRKAVKEQQATLKPPIKEETILNSVVSKCPRRQLPALPPQAGKQTQVRRRCGKGSHLQQSCPARDMFCFHCNRRGHNSSQCLSNTVAEVAKNLNELAIQSNNPQPETFDRYLKTVESTRAETWIITVEINCQPVSVKVDTRTEVTTLSDLA